MSTNNYTNKFIPNSNPLPTYSPIIEQVKQILSNAWNFNKVIQYNPSANPVSMERKHLKLLEDNLSDYIVTEKSDGYRYQLVLGKINKPNQKPEGFAVMVNRKMDVYEVSLYANPEYFEGSVFDGEMVIENVSGNQERQIFLIFDVIQLKGETRKNTPLLQRYKEYSSLFELNDKDILNHEITDWEELAFEMARDQDKIISLGNKMALQFRPKPFVTLMNLGSLWRSLSQSKHKTDGLIITRSDTLINTGTDYSTLKWKPNNTIDLIVDAKYSKGTWKYQLFFQDHDKLVSSDEKSITNDKIIYYLSIRENEMLKNTSRYFAETNRNMYRLVGEFKCVFDENNNPIIWCVVEKWRRDKQTPNHFHVIEKTLQNIKDDVTIDELIRITSSQIYNVK